MRETMKFFLAAVAALVLAGPVACAGGDDDDDAVDASGSIDSSTSNPDASSGTPDAAGNPDAPDSTGLYAPCGSVNGACVNASLSCTGITGVGSTTEGWCSPHCENNNADCAAGYTGPGTPQCALSESAGADPTLCVIVCSGAGGDCPAGLTCLDAGSAWVCAVAA